MKPVYLLAINILLLHSVMAQWNADPMRNTPVAKSISPEYVFGEAIGDGEGGSIIPFVANAGNNSFHIYAKRISSDGELVWGDSLNSVQVSTASNLAELTAITDDNGGAIFGWIRYSLNYDSSTIFFQHINAAGVVTWQVNGIKLAGNYQYNDNLRMCSDGNGGIFVGWTSHDWATNEQTYAQHINAAGLQTWATNGVLVCNAPGFRANQGIVYNGTDIIIAFRDTRNDPNGIVYNNYRNNAMVNMDLYAQKINQQGILQWPDTGRVVCNAPGNQFRPFPLAINIVTDGSGGAILVFHDTRRMQQGGADIYAQRIDNNGVRLWSDTATPVIKRAANQSLDLAAFCADSMGGVAVAWGVYDFLEGGQGVFCQRFDGNGTALWQPGGVSFYPVSLNPGLVNIVKDNEGNYVLSGVHTGDVNRVINAHKLHGTTGQKLWGNGVVISNNRPRYEETNLVKSFGNSFILSWTDDRVDPNQTDIYAAKVLPDGTLAVTVSNKFITKASGNWNDATSWTGNVVPPTTGDIIVRHSITVTQNTGCRSLKAEGPAAAITVNPGIILSIERQ